MDLLLLPLLTEFFLVLSIRFPLSLSLPLSPSLSVCVCLSRSCAGRVLCSVGLGAKAVVDFLVVAPVPCFGRVMMPNEPKRNLTKAHKATPRKMHGAVMKRIQKFIIPFAVLRIVTTRKLYDPAQRNSQSICWNDPCAETPTVFFLVSEPDPHQSNKPSTHNKQHNTNPVE